MIVVDLSITNQYDNLFKKTIESISLSNDKLKENYISVDPKNFVCFTAIIENNEIICFSGLQINADRWGPMTARCSSRMWISPKKRFTGLTKFSQGPKFLNSYYCLPIQIKKARSLGIQCLFMSRENNLQAFQKWIHLVNRNCGTNFILLKDLYNVCGKLDTIPYSCQQFIALEISSKNYESVWKTNMSQHIIKDHIQ